MRRALFCLFPAIAFLYSDGAFFEEFEHPKSWALITFACFALPFLPWRRLKSDRFAQAMALFVVSAAVSAAASVDWHMSVFGNIRCRGGLLVMASYFVLYLALLEHKDMRKLVDVVLVCSGLVSLYAILQVTGHDPMRWAGTLTTDGYTRPMSSLGHPNFMAGYLAMVLPFALWRAEGAKWVYALVPPLVAAILFSLSRGMILAAAIGVAVYLLMRGAKIMHAVMALCVVGAIAGASLVAIPSLRYTAQSRMSAFFSPGYARKEYPAAAIRIWKRYPWLGVGTDAFEIGFQRQRTPHYWQVERAGSPHRAHNDFLNTLATQGLLGALAALLVTAAAVMAMIASRSPYSAPASAAIVAFYVEGLTSFTVVATGTLFVLCVAALREEKKNAKATGDNPKFRDVRFSGF